MEAFLYYALNLLSGFFFLAIFGCIFWAAFRVMSSRNHDFALAFKPGILAALSVGLWLFSMTIGDAFVSVPAGNRGVIFSTTSGVSNRVLGEGIHQITPVFEHVQLFNIQQQVKETNTQTATKDQQSVTTHVKVWYHPEATEVNKLYQEMGTNWAEKGLLDGHLAEILKQETVKYDAMSLLSSREAIAMSTRDQIKVRLRPYHLVVDNLTIGDINFTDSFNKAIEEKQVAEQAALKKRYDLQAAKTQAEIAKAEAEGRAKSAIAEAKGQAESAKIVAAAIAGNPNYMKLKELENRKDVADILAKSNNVIYLPSTTLMNIGGAAPAAK